MNWYKKSQFVIQMTPAEKTWAEWAIDPMTDYWCSQEGEHERDDGKIYDAVNIPLVNGNALTLSSILEINEDLLYRLEEQAPSVSRTDSDSISQERSRSKGALSLAKKIRSHIG